MLDFLKIIRTSNRRQYLPTIQEFSLRQFHLNRIAQWICQLLVCLCVLSSSIATAQNIALLQRVDPQIGQRGTTVDVVFHGVYMDEPQDVLFYRPGIKVKGFKWINERIEPRDGSEHEAEPNTRLQVQLEISPDCPTGEHLFRLRTRQSLSETVPFYVTHLPVVFEDDPYGKSNDTIEVAQEVPLNSSVWGRNPAGTPQDHDFYMVNLQKGQRLSVEIVGDRLGTWHYGGMNDPAVAIFDASGQLIAKNDDSNMFITDPVLAITAPATEKYFIDVHQQMDYETLERDYILHVGTWERPLLTYPLGGPPGEMEVRLIGDPGGDRNVSVVLPSEDYWLDRDVTVGGSVGAPSRAAADGGYFDYLSSEQFPAPTANRLRVLDCPNVLESANGTVQSPVELPVAFNGIAEKEDDVDEFPFKAKKGEKWFVRVFAGGLGSLMDPRIWISDSNGKRISLIGSAGGGGGNQRLADDDATWEGLERYGHAYRHQIPDRLDPHVVFTVPADGIYTLSVADTRSHFGPMHVYRVEFIPFREKIFTYLPAYPSQPRDTRDRMIVPRGGYYPRNISLQKGLSGSFNGALTVEAIGLPAGVKMEAPVLYPGQTEFLALFKADKTAELSHTLFDIVLRPTDGNKRLVSTFKQTCINTQRRGDFAMHFAFVEQAAAAVVVQSPFHLELVQPSIPIARNGELTLTVRCKRTAEFTDAVYCEMDWLPPGINKQTPLIIPEGQSEATYRLNALGDARPGSYKLAITGRPNSGGDVRSGAGVVYTASNFIDLRVGEPYVEVQIKRASIERTKRTKILCKLKHNRPLPGKAIATLKRLPAGVNVVEPLPAITKDDTQLSFTIEASETALIGQYKDIYCEITIVEDGQQIRQQTGSGTLRIDPKRGS